jgi:hypothetical protein
MRFRLSPLTAIHGFSLAALLLAGCARSATDVSSQEIPTDRAAETALAPVGPTRQMITIERNTQATLGDLRIGAGNFHEEEYTPDGSAPRRGLTAGLWIYVRGDSSKDRFVRVYPGQTLDVPGYRLHVTEIQRTLVRLAAIRTAQP